MSDIVILKMLDSRGIRYEYWVGTVPSIQHFDSLTDQQKIWGYFIRDLKYYSLYDAQHVAEEYSKICGNIQDIYQRELKG